MPDIKIHIANLAAQANEAINKYGRLEMCRIKNIIVCEDGHLHYVKPPEELNKELELQKKKVNMLLTEIAQAVKERDSAEVTDDE